MVPNHQPKHGGEPARVRFPVELFDGQSRRDGSAEMIPPDTLRVVLTSGESTVPIEGQMLRLRVDVDLGKDYPVARVFSVNTECDQHGRVERSLYLQLLEWGDIQQSELKKWLEISMPLVVAAGLDECLDRSGLRGLRVTWVNTEEEIIKHFREHRVGVLILGPKIGQGQSRTILQHCLAQFPQARSANIVLTSEWAPEAFQEFIDNDQVFYLARGITSAQQLRSLIVAGLDRHEYWSTNEEKSNVNEYQDTHLVLDLCARLSQQIDLESACRLVIDAIKKVSDADRAQCLIYDSKSDSFGPQSAASLETGCNSAAAGLLGYVVRTGEGVQLDCIGSDSRYDEESDNPGGCETDRFVVEPIAATGGVLGVVTAARVGTGLPFSETDVRRLRLLAKLVVPALSWITSESQKRAEAQEGARLGLNLFREEAIDSYRASSGREGSLLFVIPAWLRVSHVLILILLVVGSIYTILARVDETASGPIIVRARDKVVVSATAAGLVRSVMVTAGDRVREGDVLARLQPSPGDPLTQRWKKEFRAPVAGLVSDVRVRAGEEVNIGDQVFTITDEKGAIDLIALLPGSYAPQIRPGMNLIVGIEGYPDSHEIIPIDTVASEIIGPQEVARYLGKENMGSLNLSGPIVIVMAPLRARVFQANERTYTYHDGMIGRAHVSVHSERLILVLIPSLKRLARHPEQLFRVQ